MENRNLDKSYIYSIDMAGMTIALLVVAAAMLIPLAVFRFDILKAAGSSPFFIIAIAFWFILHEIIHGIFYRMSKGIKNKDIAFGARIEKGVLFCLCKKPISKNEIIRSLLAPLILIGFVTLIIGFVFSFDLLIILSLMNICGAMGDILMTLFIAGMPKNMRYIEDNGNRFVLITNEDISKKKSLGVKLEEVEEDFAKIAISDSPKVAISKGSYAIFALICLHMVLSYLKVF